jgi:hypothetical protein
MAEGINYNLTIEVGGMLMVIEVDALVDLPHQVRREPLDRRDDCRDSRFAFGMT